MMEDELEEIYTNPSKPGSFAGPDKLKKGYQAVNDAKISRETVKKFLQKKDTYTKFRVARKNFKRNPIIAPHIDAQWQADLADVSNISDTNQNVKFLLVVIDVVSKYLWVEPLLSKEASVTLEGFKKIFRKSKRQPKKLQTDAGGEFVNTFLKSFLDKKGITFFTLSSEKKAAIAERVIRTLKDRLYRYMHEHHTKRYINVLQKIVHSYNNTYHKSIKMTPASVTKENEGKVLNNLYGKTWAENLKKIKKPKFNIGDYVRVSSQKQLFEPGYRGNWSEEVFIIEKIKSSAIPQIMYYLKDWWGEKIDGGFYAEQLQLLDIDPNRNWKVEKILNTRINSRGEKEYEVKWEGYPVNKTSWVPASQVIKIKK